MSNNSSTKQQSSGSTHLGTPQQPLRTIPDIISTLQTSFRGTDFKEAERELMSREESLVSKKDTVLAKLREKCDVLEGNVRELRLEKVAWENERTRLVRDVEVKDYQLNDSARDLRVCRDSEAKAVKRCDRWLKEIEVLEREKEGLLRDRDKDRCDYAVKVALLREDLGRRVEGLEAEKANFDAVLGGLERDVEEKGARIRVLEEEKENFVTLLGRRGVEEEGRKVEELMRRIKGLEEEKAGGDVRFEEMRRVVEEKVARIGVLEEEKANFDTLLRDMERDVEEKDREVEELMRRIKGLEEEKAEGETHLEEMRRVVEESDGKLKQVEERFLKLQEDAINCLCSKVENDKKFGSTHIGKIIAAILNEIEAEECEINANGGVKKDGNAQEEDSAYAPHVNEPKCPMKSTIKSEEAIRRTLDFEDEKSRENGVTINRKTPFIDLVDSDDDDETPLAVNSLKRKRESSNSLRELHNCDGSADDRSYSKLKSKKLEHVLHEPVKASIATSGSRGDHKFSSSQSQTLGAIKKCQASGEVKGESAHVGDDHGVEDIRRSLKPDTLSSHEEAEVEKLITSARKFRENKELPDSAAMVCAFAEDPVFCAQAVCALYRWHKSQFSWMSNAQSRVVEPCDVERITSLAKFLTNGVLCCKRMKSVNDLRQHDPSGPDECTRLARRYYKHLFEIFKNKKDTFFSPSSADVDYS